MKRFAYVETVSMADSDGAGAVAEVVTPEGEPDLRLHLKSTGKINMEGSEFFEDEEGGAWVCGVEGLFNIPGLTDADFVRIVDPPAEAAMWSIDPGLGALLWARAGMVILEAR